MTIDTKAGIYILLIPAFLVYFVSELFLRQSAVSNIDPQTVSPDTIIAELPASLKESIKYKIQLGQLNDAVLNAANNSERAYAMCNLADFTKSASDKDKIFKEVVAKYSSAKESARAFVFFFDVSDDCMTPVRKYHEQMKKFDAKDQFYMWAIGLAKLVELKADHKMKLDYLRPLLDTEPKYRNYAKLFDLIAECASNLQDTAVFDKAKTFEAKCADAPYIEEAFEKIFKTDAKK